MKRSILLLAVLAGIGIVLFAVVLVLGGGTVLYEASDDAFSPEHKDVSAVSVMTTEEAETISPLMAEIMMQSLKVALEIDAKDHEYSERELQEYANLLNRLKTNNAKIKLGNTEINDFRISAEELNIALEVLNLDVARVEEIKQEIRDGSLTGADLAALYAEVQVLSKEITLTAETYSASAETMMEIAKNHNLDTSHLEQSIETVKKFSEETSGGVSSFMPGSSDLQIMFTISGETFAYGDSVVIEGSSKLSGLHEIYLDTRVWGSVNLSEPGSFTKSFKITNVPKGQHTIFIQNQEHVSKQESISVVTSNTTVFIGSAKVNGNTVTISGGLRTEDDLPVSGAKVDVYADGIGLLGTNTTNRNGIFTLQTELEDGEYLVYAEFSDFSFPLERSVSEPVLVRVSQSFLLPILGLAVLGISAFAGARIFRKRRAAQAAESAEFETGILNAVKPTAAKKIVNTIREFIAGSMKKEDSDKLRVLYHETVSVIAFYEGISNTAVKTPREILSAVTNPCAEVREFMAEYEYLHYADVEVLETDLEKMKMIAGKISEKYHENKK